MDRNKAGEFSWILNYRVLAVRAGNVPFAQNFFTLRRTDGVPFGILEPFDKSESIGLASRQSFGLASAYFCKLLFEFGGVFLEVSDSTTGRVFRISIGSNNNCPHGVLVSIVEAPDGRQRLARGRKQLLFTQIIKKRLLRHAVFAAEKTSEHENGAAQQPHGQGELKGIGPFHVGAACEA